MLARKGRHGFLETQPGKSPWGKHIQNIPVVSKKCCQITGEWRLRPNTGKFTMQIGRKTCVCMQKKRETTTYVQHLQISLGCVCRSERQRLVGGRVLLVERVTFPGQKIKPLSTKVFIKETSMKIVLSAPLAKPCKTRVALRVASRPKHPPCAKESYKQTFCTANGCWQMDWN